MFVVHVGLHKTATTSLQKDIYPNIDEYDFIGRGFSNLKDQEELYLKIADFCFSSEEVDYSYELEIKNLIVERLRGSNLLLSEEWLTADYSEFFGFEGAIWQKKLDRLSRLLRGIDHKIIVSLRDPVDGIFSQYCEFLTVGVDNYYTSFLDYALNSNDAKVYQYCNFNDFIRERFCSVSYFTFEDIKSDPDLIRLREVLGVSKLSELGHHNKKNKLAGTVQIEKQRESIKFLLGMIPRSLKDVLKRVQPFVSLRDAILSYFSDRKNIPYPNDEVRQQLEAKFKASYVFLNELSGT
ncbi:sulfotransferase [Marinobacter alexandrii]|uniref:sulfotransferase n=1 Tax=Marinobacter alexandrii TaxID=2570351 RepID=UPI001FFEF565|nr:sulfotransferase [Marinobacter alexandrii]MCK2150075.1 sulfotransferase [Marinobacter alexandrii]